MNILYRVNIIQNEGLYKTKGIKDLNSHSKLITILECKIFFSNLIIGPFIV